MLLTVIRNSVLRKSPPKTQLLPPSEIEKRELKNYQTILRKESLATQHTVQLFKFLRYGWVGDEITWQDSPAFRQIAHKAPMFPKFLSNLFTRAHALHRTITPIEPFQALQKDQ